MRAAPKNRKRTRLNIQLTPDLVDWAKDYARRHNMTVTSIITSLLRDLMERDTEVPQV